MIIKRIIGIKSSDELITPISASPDRCFTKEKNLLVVGIIRSRRNLLERSRNECEIKESLFINRSFTSLRAKVIGFTECLVLTTQ